jgi:hypothetical protein
MPIEFIGMIGVRPPEAVGARRLVDLARRGEIHDRRLWTLIAAAVAGAGNTTALVGTPEQVAESLLEYHDYHDLGVTTLLIRGFDPLHDALEYGRELIPLVRREVARRDRAAAWQRAGSPRMTRLEEATRQAFRPERGLRPRNPLRGMVRRGAPPASERPEP